MYQEAQQATDGIPPAVSGLDGRILVVWILNRSTSSSKYGTNRKNTQRYYIPKRLIRCIYYPLH